MTDECINIGKRRCSKCGKLETLDKFCYLDTQCKSCKNDYNKKYHESHRDEAKEYRENNKDKINAYRRKYYQTHKDKKIKQSIKWRAENIERSWAYQSIYNHKKRGMIVEFTSDELLSTHDTRYCAICGQELVWCISEKKGLKIKGSPTIDRINNEKTMTLSNIQITCSKCNTMKQDLTMKQFIEYCTLISNKFSGDSNE